MATQVTQEHRKTECHHISKMLLKLHLIHGNQVQLTILLLSLCYSSIISTAANLQSYNVLTSPVPRPCILGLYLEHCTIFCTSLRNACQPIKTKIKLHINQMNIKFYRKVKLSKQKAWGLRSFGDSFFLVSYHYNPAEVFLLSQQIFLLLIQKYPGSSKDIKIFKMKFKIFISLIINCNCFRIQQIWAFRTLLK